MKENDVVITPLGMKAKILTVPINPKNGHFELKYEPNQDMHGKVALRLELLRAA